MAGVKLDRNELALRMLEAAVGFRRPSGVSADDALALAPSNLSSAYRRAAEAATAYFVECGARISIDVTKEAALLPDDRSPINKAAH